jgi:hypothetical protein
LEQQTTFISYTDGVEQRKKKVDDAYALWEKMIVLTARKGIDTTADMLREFERTHHDVNGTALISYRQKLHAMMKMGALLLSILTKPVAEPVVYKRIHIAGHASSAGIAGSSGSAGSSSSVGSAGMDCNAFALSINTQMKAAWCPALETHIMYDILVCRHNTQLANLVSFADCGIVERLIAKAQSTSGTLGVDVPVPFVATTEVEHCLQFLCGLCDRIMRHFTPHGMLPAKEDECWAAYNYDPCVAWRSFRRVVVEASHTICVHPGTCYKVSSKRMVTIMQDNAACPFSEGLLLCFARFVHEVLYHLVVTPLALIKKTVHESAKRIGHAIAHVFSKHDSEEEEEEGSDTEQDTEKDTDAGDLFAPCVPYRAAAYSPVVYTPTPYTPTPYRAPQFGAPRAAPTTTFFESAVREACPEIAKKPSSYQMLLVCDNAFAGTALRAAWDRAGKKQKAIFCQKHVVDRTCHGDFVTLNRTVVDPGQLAAARLTHDPLGGSTHIIIRRPIADL